eukprot:3481299-Pyramimonas_sp.AAC.2
MIGDRGWPWRGCAVKCGRTCVLQDDTLTRPQWGQGHPGSVGTVVGQDRPIPPQALPRGLHRFRRVKYGTQLTR